MNANNPAVLSVFLTALMTAIVAPAAAQFPGLEDPGTPMCAADDGRIQVLLVGSYHMSNPGMDEFNLEADDVLTEKRQREIRAVVERLAEFRSTKVAVEAPWGDTVGTARYNAYQSGTGTLRRSEEEQIGFRLAHHLDHDRVYPIDVRLMLNDEALGPVIGQDPRFVQSMQQLDSLGKNAMATMAQWLAEGTIGEMLANMNQPQYIELAHQPYIRFFAPMVAGDTYAGADMVADWYKRNLRIFANLTRFAEPGDRIFVIYGQGHIKLLKDAVIQHPDYCAVDPLRYLP